MDYFEDNPRILCPTCKEHDFRRKGFDRYGNERTYTQCMQCSMDEWYKRNLEKVNLNKAVK